MSRLDLNLLRIFLVLWDERSVSKAADTIHVTQSAMSHSLKRLRAMLGDELFTRRGRSLAPTELAISLEPRLRAALRQVEIAVEPGEFNPLLSDRTFVIAAGTANCEMLLPAVVSVARAEAPLTSMKIIGLGPEVHQQLESGVVDVALGVFDTWPSHVQGEALYREDMVWVAREGHPIGASATEGDLRNMDRVEVSSARLPVNFADRAVVQPRTAIQPTGGAMAGEAPMRPLHAATIVVYDNRTAMEVISAGDLVGMLPRRVVVRYAEVFGVRIVDTGAVPASNSISMIWSPQQTETSGHAWLRALIRRLAGLPMPMPPLPSRANVR